MTRDQNGNIVTVSPKLESDGTWSATVWWGSHPATNVSRRFGYLTREAARQADISETPGQTNSRVCGRP